MEKSRVDYFLADLSKKMPPERMPEIEQMLYNMDEAQFMRVAAAEYKDTTTMLLVSIFLGTLGIDRFLLGDIGMGVLKLLTQGVCYVLWIIDIINIGKMTRDYNFKAFMQAAGYNYAGPQA